MTADPNRTAPMPPAPTDAMTRFAVLLLTAAASVSGGCAALSNPVADGIPVRRVPEEVLGRPRSELEIVPLNLLRQVEPEEYRLDRGDVLAIVADDIIAPAGQATPVRLPDALNPNAASGFPVPVGDDGNISLPRLPPIQVKGKTLRETEQLIKDYATGKAPGSKELVRPGAERVIVQLLTKRTYLVIVVRQDQTQQTTIGSGGALGGSIIGTDLKATGTTIRLQAYENDLLHALNATGGVPGNQSEDHVTIIRGKYDPGNPLANAQKVPIRVYPDQRVTITPDDVILNDGDILFVEARNTDVYYTSGLIGTGQFLLPRDTDLRVIEAIARVRGPLVNGGFSSNNFVAQSVNTGVGNPSPSLVTIVRKLPNNQQILIRVDLDLAFRDPRENIIVRPGDMLVMQEKAGQSLIRYLTQTIRVTTVADTIRSANLNQVTTGNNP